MQNPVLKDIRGTKTISLPGYEGSSVVLYDSVLVGDAMQIEKMTKESSPEQLIQTLPVFIKSWNFNGEDGKPMPIDAKSIGLLSIEAVTAIAEEVSKLVEGKKKDTKA